MQNLNLEDALVLYQKDYLTSELSDQIFIELSELFNNEEKKMIHDDKDNKMYRLNRKTMVFIDASVDQAIIPKIWGKNVTVLEFSPVLYKIKSDLESKLNFKFNICLANYYANGKNAIGWHSDNEEKGSTSCIASISLGAERLFTFRKRDIKNTDPPRYEQSQQLFLSHNSLIVMGPGCQENYHHSLPVDKTVKNARLNLTFRLFDNERYKNY